MESIRLHQVSLERRTQEELSYDLKRTIFEVIEGKYRKPPKKLILDNVSLAIESGKKIGIIGSNGSGKSTLLKVICGILEPSAGSVRVRGRVAPLIELGAGFDPDLSVMDNIVLYGVLLGFQKKQMENRIRDILDFSELQDYAFAPVKGLSSGMVARLGFAIATDVQPDILILDEVLSVGDERFKTKCKHRMDQFWAQNITVLIVSHSMEFIRESCDQVIWLDRGKIRFIGSPNDTVNEYLQCVYQSNSTI
jgi:ABC-2 type transport system ATP-binding protein